MGQWGYVCASGVIYIWASWYCVGKYGTVGCCMGNVWASRVMYGLVGLCIDQWGDYGPTG